MKRKAGFVAGGVLLGLACICLISGIVWKGGQISENRYGSICAEGNDVYCYANKNIYKYNGNDNVQIVQKNVSPYFEILESCLYYVSGRTLTGLDLHDYAVKIEYQAEKENFHELQICGIKNGILKLELYKKNPTGSSYIYLSLKTGEDVGETGKKKWEDIQEEPGEEAERAADDFSRFLDGYTAEALTDEDILYVRWPQGESHISSYKVERAETGEATGVTLIEENVSFAQTDYTHKIVLWVLSIIFAAAGVLTLWYSKKQKKI